MTTYDLHHHPRFPGLMENPGRPSLAWLRRHGGAAVGGLLLAVVLVLSGAISLREEPVGLGSWATARDYLQADPSAQAAFVARMCDGDACLAPGARDCGWLPPDLERSSRVLGRCLTLAAESTAAATPLADLGRYCAMVFARLEPASAGNPEACRAAGGTWGDKRVDPLP